MKVHRLVMPIGLLVSLAHTAGAAGFVFTLFAGGDLPVATERVRNAYDSGTQFGLQVRHLLRPHLSLVGEAARSHNDAPSAPSVPFGVAAGGDRSSTRFSAGVAFEPGDDEGKNLYFKALAGLYHSSFSDLRFAPPPCELPCLPGVAGRAVPSSDDFGINLGGGLELPLGGSLSFFAGVDLDVVFGQRLARRIGDVILEGPTDTIADVTGKAGIVFRP